MKGNTAATGPLEMPSLGAQAPRSEEAQDVGAIQPTGPPAESLGPQHQPPGLWLRKLSG